MPVTDGNIYTVAVANNGTIYIGGDFTTVGGVARNRIAAISSTGTVTSWNPNASGSVLALALSSDNSIIYVGGGFNGASSIGGATRNYIAALSASTGSSTSWNPNAQSNVRAISLNPTSSIVYVGGDFTLIGGAGRNRIAALDASLNSNNATAWNPGISGGLAMISAIAVSADGQTIYAGGGFTFAGGLARNNILAIDASTGTSTSWNPNANGQVQAILINSSTVYVGGTFTTIGGQTRNRLAALSSTSTGNATSWNPDISTGTGVDGLALINSTLYVSGAFSGVNGGTVTRNNLASFLTNFNTSNVTSWDPNADAEVYAIAASSSVYVGGSFLNIGGSSRAYFAQFDPPTISLSANTTTILESGGTTTITATLSATTTDPVTTTLIFGGTAVNNTNYTRSSSTIVIPAGFSTGTITISALNQGVFHSPDLYVTTSISSATNVFVSSTASVVTTTITNVNASVVAPTAPTSTSNIASSSIRYNWTSGRGGETYYILDKSTNGTTFTFVATSTPTSTTNYTFTGLTPNTQYWFRVASGYNNSATSSYITSSPVYTLPSTPSALNATLNANKDTITLTFTGDGTEYYVNSITQGTSPGWSSSTTYTFSNLSCGTSYQFQVKARNPDNNETSYSGTVTAATTFNCPSGGGSSGGGGGGYTPPSPSTPLTTPVAPIIFTSDILNSELVSRLSQQSNDSESKVTSPHSESLITFFNLPAAPFLKAGGKITFAYSFTNSAAITQRFNMVRTLTHKTSKKKIYSKTGYRTLKPSQSFSYAVKEYLPKNLKKGTYVVNIAIQNADKNLKIHEEFEIEIR